MIAEIISVGTELLLGDIVNTNAQFLAQQLAALGICVHYQTVVGDNNARVEQALDIAFARSDMVITTGGLGPTKDDLTKELVSSYLGRKLVLDQRALDEIGARMRKYGHQEVSASNMKQAYFPEGAIVLYNENGTAPGCIVENAGKRAILLPGPPREMEPLFKKYVIDYLRRLSDQCFVSVNVKLHDIGESSAADRISDLLDYENPTVAPYAKPDGVLLRITAAAPDQAAGLEMIEPVLAEIKQLLDGHIKEIIKPL